MADPYSFGEKIEDYNVLNLLGKGGFACVYRAKCRRSGQEVAIKMIDKKLMKAADMVSRVRQEVEIHSRMKHPSILELYTYFEDQNYVYLVLELCHLGELHGYLKKNASNQMRMVLSEQEAATLMEQITSGMLYLHSHGILHRDLTLANLLLTRSMHVKIADFGLATRLEMPDEKHFTMCGTPNYISPEIAMRTSHGLEADVWSLGCMLYTFLVGRPPFDTDAVKSTLDRVIQAEYDLPDHLSAEAKDLIQLLLRKNPKERIALSDIPRHPFMKKRYPVSYKQLPCQNYVEASLDSGQGTMSTETGTNSWTRNNNYSTSRHRPVLGLPIKEVQSYLSEQDFYKTEQSPENLKVFPQKTSKRYIHYDIHPASYTPQSGTFPKVGSTDGDLSKRHNDLKTPVVYQGRTIKSFLSDNSHQKIIVEDNSISASNKCYNYNNNSNNAFWGKFPNEYGETNFKNLKCQESSGSSSSISYSGSICSNSGNLAPHDPSSASHPNLSDHSSNSNSLYLKHGAGCTTSDISSEGSNPEIGLENMRKVLTLENGDCQTKTSTPCDQQSVLPSKMDGTQSSIIYSNSQQIASANIKNYQISVSVTKPNKESSKSIDNIDSTQKASKEIPPLSPLSSNRLRPIRQRTKTAIVSILDTGDVCLEFVKNRSKEERVAEIFLISPDGQQITIYQPNGCLGLNTKVLPPPPSDNVSQKVFQLKTLPDKYQKKYQYASKFVKLVRSKTPKVTLYTQKAKCMLMENFPNPDFEADFYDGAKFTISANGIRIIESNGTSLLLESGDTGQRFSQETQTLLIYVKENRQRCLELEQVINSVEMACSVEENLFPVIIGRKPANIGIKTDVVAEANCAKQNPSATVNVDLCPTDILSSSGSTVVSNNLIGAPTLIGSSNTQQTKPSSSSSSSSSSLSSHTPTVAMATSSVSSNHSNGLSSQCSQNNRIVRQVFVPDVGWSFQHFNGEIWIRFNDGTQLGVKPSGQAFKYVDIEGKMIKYQKMDVLPNFVKKKLETVPVIVKSLLSDSKPQPAPT